MERLPIFPTGNMLVKASSVLAGLIARMVGMMCKGCASMVHGSNTGSDSDSDMLGLVETSSDESEGYFSDEWITDGEHDLYNNVAQFTFEAEARKVRAHSRRVVHTPQSWQSCVASRRHFEYREPHTPTWASSTPSPTLRSTWPCKHRP